MVDACVDAHGRVDYALNVAGIVPQRTPIADVDVETFERVIDINEYGVSALDPKICTNFVTRR